jgi:hypothetical protein
LATRIGGRINAAIEVLLGLDGLGLPQRYSLYCLVEDDGTKYFPSSVVRAEGRSAAVFITVDDGVLRAKLSEWLDMTFKEERVGDALWHFSKEPDWFNLWKVYELVQGEIDPKEPRPKRKRLPEVVKRNWWSEGELDSYEASSHDPDFSDDAARHAVVDKRHAGATRITIEQGANLVRRLLLKWLESRRR